MARKFRKLDRRTLVLGGAVTAGLWRVPGLSSVGAHAGEKATQGPATIAVAASLRFVFEEAVSIWCAASQNISKNDIRMVFGATSTLVHQIENGAPFDALFAADVKSPQRLSQKNLTLNAPAIFAHGRLALIAANSSELQVDSSFNGLKAAVRAGQLNRFAIANPELAPYGIAAVQALQKAGIWTEIATRLALGENVGQAAQFAMSGAAEAGLIALSLTRSTNSSNSIKIAVVDQNWHDPIDHAMVRLLTTSAVTDQFCAFVGGKEMDRILSRHGFAALSD